MPGSKKGRKVNAAKGGRTRMLSPRAKAAKRRLHTIRMMELLLAGKTQTQIAADIGMSGGYVSELRAEAVTAALGQHKEAFRACALEQAHMHHVAFDLLRQFAFDRSLRVRTVDNNGEVERVIEVADFEALRKMTDGMAKQSERFGKICGTDAPTKVEVEAPPGLSPDELAEVVRLGRQKALP